MSCIILHLWNATLSLLAVFSPVAFVYNPTHSASCLACF